MSTAANAATPATPASAADAAADVATTADAKTEEAPQAIRSPYAETIKVQPDAYFEEMKASRDAYYHKLTETVDAVVADIQGDPRLQGVYGPAAHARNRNLESLVATRSLRGLLQTNWERQIEMHDADVEYTKHMANLVATMLGVMKDQTAAMKSVYHSLDKIKVKPLLTTDSDIRDMGRELDELNDTISTAVQMLSAGLSRARALKAHVERKTRKAFPPAGRARAVVDTSMNEDSD